LFRDYLAAKYISGKTDSLEDGWWSDIRDHIDDPGWRNILRLIPICLLRQGRDRVDLFFELLGRSCDGRSFSERARRVALGGKVLQELRRLGYETKPVSAWHNETANVGGVFEISPDLPDLTTRFETAVAIGLEGDPRLSDFDATWTSLPSGAFFMGAQSSDPAAECFDRDSAPWEAPVREITIEGFDVRRYPVTVADYSEFLDSGGYSEEGVGFWSTEAWQWRTVSRVSSPLDWDRQLDMPNAPITGISWFEAVAYCAWLSSVPEARFTYRLPYESEWEYAAKHGVPKGQQFAWGNRMTYGDDAEANWAGCYLRQKSPVGVFPRSTTEDGIADLFGNVEEWCLDEWRATIPDEPPYEADDRFPSVFRLVRGGSTIRFSRLCRPSYRGRILQHRRYHTVGFRPVRVL
jgi:formylglycine-generating enzyme required for sulfatase activity